jgi:hypothetical protein
LSSDHDHETLVPFQQFIVIGVEANVLFPLQVKFTLYPLLVVTGTAPVIELHVEFMSVALTELQVWPVITHPSGLLY